MITVIGEILIDRFPEYERIGGAPFNFAFHLKQLGWPVRFITRIGDDADGRHILHQLAEHQFDLEDIQIDSNHRTGLVKIALDYQGVPQFDILKDVAYDHIDLTSMPTDRQAGGQMVYFGTLAQRTENGFQQFQQFLKHQATSAKGFCDINLRAPHVNRDAIEASLHQADILKLNSNELIRVGTFFNGPASPEALITWVMETFEIKLMALTLGDQGSRAITPRGSINAAPQLIDNVIDTVGAGDAYAAILAAGLLKRLTLSRTLKLATEFAAQICTMPGAVPENSDLYDQLRHEIGKDAA